ncbi:myotrophin [Oryzias melastigma]|uniref:Myotrophin-like n=1 Tax=Oryzias melastigma TaxID=30732 RepID=A0A3B3D3B0_ORYME|nr:myotrophin [Oryzias melastigma]
MGDTQLIWALKTGDLDEVKMKLKTKEDANRLLESTGYPIHFVSDFGHKDVLEYLISIGADVNAKDKYGMTPLLSACYENHVACVKLLLEKGADKRIKGPDNQTAIDVADSEEMKALFK